MKVGDIIYSNKNSKNYLIVGYIYPQHAYIYEKENIIKSSNYEQFVRYMLDCIISLIGIEVDNIDNISEVFNTNRKFVLINDKEMYTRKSRYEDINKIESYILKKRLLHYVVPFFTENELQVKLKQVYNKEFNEILNRFLQSKPHIRVKSQLDVCGIYLYVNNEVFVVLKNKTKYFILCQVHSLSDIFNILDRVRNIKTSYVDFELSSYYETMIVIDESNLRKEFQDMREIKTLDITKLFLLDSELDKIIE